MRWIINSDNMADLVVLDGGDIYKAGKNYGMVPVAGEVYDTELNDASYYAVAVAKATDNFNLKNLKVITKDCY